MTSWDELLASAARLQRIVPDAVLVGGTAAAFYARHRLSIDHDHVLADLTDRFELVLEAVEREADWVTNRVTPGKIILGSLGGIETGIRQLIRARPLEVTAVQLPTGQDLRVPTAPEVLRIKGFLIVKRNQVRDYLDLAALADRYGINSAAKTLIGLDDYYAAEPGARTAVASQLAVQLANPQPADGRTLSRLSTYKGLERRWQNWNQVVLVCQDVATTMLEAADGGA